MPVPSDRALSVLAIACAALFIVLSVCPPEAADMAVARWIWSLGPDHWTNGWWLNTFSHRWLKLVPKIAGLALLAAMVWVAAAKRKDMAWLSLRLLLSIVLSVMVVHGLKSYSNIACPWDFAEFGGDQSFRAPFEWIISHMPRPKTLFKCWPAGHATVIFGLWGFYFAARRFWPRWQNAIALAILVIGIPVAFGRMLQGAHFLSHSVDTFLVDIFIGWLAFAIPGPGSRPSDSACLDRHG